MIKVVVDVLPRNSIYFSTEKGKSQTKVVTIVNNESDKLKIKKIDNPLEDVSVTYEPFTAKRCKELMLAEADSNTQKKIKIPEKGDYIIVLTLSDKAKVGQINGNINIFTNKKKKQKVELRVRGRVSGPFKIQPTFLSLGRIPEKISEPIVKEFTLTHSRGIDFVIKGVECKEPHFKFKYTQNPDKSYKITATYKGGFPLGRSAGNIDVLTDDKDQPSVQLHYSGFIATEAEMKKYKEQMKVNRERRNMEASGSQTKPGKK